QGDEQKPRGADPDISDRISQGPPRSENRRYAAKEENEKYQLEREFGGRRGACEPQIAGELPRLGPAHAPLLKKYAQRAEAVPQPITLQIQPRAQGEKLPQSQHRNQTAKRRHQRRRSPP